MAEKISDSYKEMRWNAFNNLMEDYGRFELIQSQDIAAENEDLGKRIEECTYWADYEKGLFLKVESNRTVKNTNKLRIMNFLDMMFQLNLPKPWEHMAKEEKSSIRKGLSLKRYHPVSRPLFGEYALMITKDLRDGFFTYLNMLDDFCGKYGYKTRQPWTEFRLPYIEVVPDLELRNMKSSDKSQEQKVLTLEKLARLPEKARKMLGLE